MISSVPTNNRAETSCRDGLINPGRIIDQRNECDILSVRYLSYLHPRRVIRILEYRISSRWSIILRSSSSSGGVRGEQRNNRNRRYGRNSTARMTSWWKNKTVLWSTNWGKSCYCVAISTHRSQTPRSVRLKPRATVHRDCDNASGNVYTLSRSHYKIVLIQSTM